MISVLKRNSTINGNVQNEKKIEWMKKNASEGNKEYFYKVVIISNQQLQNLASWVNNMVLTPSIELKFNQN